MADSKLTALTETSVPALDDLLYTVDVSDTTDDAAGSSRKLTLQRALGQMLPHVCQGRLTPLTGTPVYAPSPSLTPSATDTTADTCDFAAAHGWTTGTIVTVSATVGGLTAGTRYWINATDSDTVSFHTTLADAIAATSKVNLTASVTSRIIVLGVTATTLYFAPHTGNRVSLYDGTRWRLYSFTERSLAFSASLTSGKNYDVFLYDNSGTLTLELSAAWTSDTVRADALTTQDGVYVKSGATTRRWLGTIRASATDTIESTTEKQYVWNACNQIALPLSRYESAASWTYTLATFQQANANAANQVDWVCGLPTTFAVTLLAHAANSSASITRSAGIGMDGITSVIGLGPESNADGAGERTSLPAAASGVSPIGRHYLTWLEYSGASGTCTWYGSIQGRGLQGFVMG